MAKQRQARAYIDILVIKEIALVESVQPLEECARKQQEHPARPVGIDRFFADRIIAAPATAEHFAQYPERTGEAPRIVFDPTVPAQHERRCDSGGPVLETCAQRRERIVAETDVRV